MTLEELRKEAEEALRTGSGNVILRIPKGKFPRRFPRGELLAEEKINGTICRIYRFDAWRVLEFVKKRQP